MEGTISSIGTVTDIDEMTFALASIIKDGAIDNDIRQLAVTLADSGFLGVINNNKITELTPGSAAGIFNWVYDNIKYVPDPDGIELFQTPHVTIKNYFGDCDDIASLLGSLYRSIGFGYALVFVQMEGWKTFNHVYGAVYTTDGWKYADASNKDDNWNFDDNYTDDQIIKRKVVILSEKMEGDDFFKDNKTEITYYKPSVPGLLGKSLMPFIIISGVCIAGYLLTK